MTALDVVDRLLLSAGPHPKDCYCLTCAAIREITGLRRDLERSMANHVADINPAPVSSNQVTDLMRSVRMGQYARTFSLSHDSAITLVQEIERLRIGIQRLQSTCCGSSDEKCNGCRALLALVDGARLPAETKAPHPDTARLNFVESECAELRCIDDRGPDDADLHYEVWKFYMQVPKERPIGMGSGPREAIDAAMKNEDDECCFCGQERNCGICSPVKSGADPVYVGMDLAKPGSDSTVYFCPTCKTELAWEGDVCGLCFPVAQP